MARRPLRRAGNGVHVTGLVFIGIGMAVVAIILLLGLSTLFVEGPKARSWSNRLMRMRVLAQFVTILIALAVFYLYRH